MVKTSDRKMLFFDIDGTLITDDADKIFPDSAKEAIRLARENGHLAFINSGRVFVNIEESIRAVGFDGYVCGCGTNIYYNGEELLHNELTHEKCMEIALKCREMGLMAIFEHKSLTAYDREVKGEAHREILEYFKNMKKKLVDNICSEEFIFDKFTAWYEDGNSRVEEFRQYISQDFECIDREGNFFELVPRGYSKATGIGFLSTRLNIPLDNIFVFGDSNNDLEMLKYVPNSIAMGVCTPEVEEASSYKTDKVTNDGIYKALKHFGVI
ncbi:MAG: HAD-IIB family hydrolase [Wujia sp.]